jgi:hypothetical protein
MALAGLSPLRSEADYAVGFVPRQVPGAPIAIIGGSGKVEDSDVGNENYYLTACYVAHNASTKQVVLERYKIVVSSALDGAIATKYDDVRHTIEPSSDDLPFEHDIDLPSNLRGTSECLKQINLWGDGISNVIFSVDAIEYADGTTWKAVPTIQPKPHTRE